MPDEVRDLRRDTDRRFGEVWTSEDKHKDRTKELELFRARAGGFMFAISIIVSIPSAVAAIVAVVMVLD